MFSFKNFIISLLACFATLVFSAKVSYGQPLSGSYTVDTTGSGDFTSISAAAQDLNQKGVSGPVTINIKPGFYKESIRIDSIPGTSPQNTVTFQSSTQDSSDVEIFQKGSNSAQLIRLKATDHVTFQHLKLVSRIFFQSGARGEVFYIKGGVTHLTIKNCRMIGTYSEAVKIDLDFQSKIDVNQVKIKNNYVKEGVFSTAGFNNTAVHNLIVKDNVFLSDGNVRNIKVKGTENVTITGNQFSGEDPGYIAIEMQGSNSGNLRILGNKIYNYKTGISLEGNKISNFKTSLIANNFITASAMGIRIDYDATFSGKFYYNSIFINDVSKPTTLDKVAIIFSHKGVYKNNIFASKSGQVVGVNDTSSFTADYNNYYTTAKNFGFTANWGPIHDDTIKSFSAFKQRFNSGKHSHQFNPGFLSDSNLHATNNQLKGKGTPINAITEDIDGDQRDAQNPDIGADEITAVPDLVVTSGAVQPQSIQTDESFKVNWSVKNKGNISVKSPWQDAIYLSRDTLLDEKQDYLLGSDKVRLDLKTGEQYSKALGVNFPFIDSSGQYHVLVKTNDSGTTERPINNVYPIGNQLNVTLSDRADLELTQLQVPNSVNSGEEFKISYTVKNKGNKQTEGAWQDRFYIGSSQSALQNQLIPAASVVLSEAGQQAPISLKPGQSYQASLTKKFPLRFSGQYFVKGFTDQNKAITEYNEGKDNTRLSSSFNVQQTPLPDLKITNISVDNRYFSGDQALFNYTIENIGSKDTEPYPRLDKVWITNGEYREKLGEIGQVGTIKKGGQRIVQDSFSMPKCKSDSFWFQITTDIGQDLTELSEANNTTLSDTFNLVLRPQPDLIVENVNVLTNNPTTEGTGEVELTIKNNGNGEYLYGQPGFLYNAIYLSKDQNLNVNKDRFLSLQNMKTDLPPGAEKQTTISFKIPADVPGDYYIMAYTDKQDQICEVPYEDNNEGSTNNKVSIQLAPVKDLKPAQWDFNPKDRKTGETVNLTATVQNQKPGSLKDFEWDDRLLLISKQSNDTIHLKSQRNKGSVVVKNQYKFRKTFDIPVTISSGQYYMGFYTDYENDVYEHQGESNNQIESSAFQINVDSNAVSDLAAESITLQSTPQSGQKLKFDYTTKNASQKPIELSGWDNQVLLKNRDGKVIQSQQIKHYGQLKGNQSVKNSASIAIPNGKSGPYQLFVKLDSTNKIYEYNTTNNKIQQSISVKLSPSADLESEITNIPNQVRSGQRLTLNYSVSNKGKKDLTNRNWTDNIYLSRNQILDPADLQIASLKRKGQNLAASNTTAFTDDILLPVNINGYYYVITKTDGNDQVYEGGQTTNNVFVSNNQVQVKQALPADLEVKDIQILSRGKQSVTFDAEVINNGPNAVKGNWQYSAHVSQDAVWNPGDPRQSGKVTLGQINAGASATLNITFDYPVVKPDYYRIFLRLDKLNQIPETDEDNNTHLLADSFRVSFLDTLTVDQKRQDQYNNQFDGSKPAYYQMDVGKDTGIYLKLRPDKSYLNTELYTKTEAIPDSRNYDHKHGNPLQADQNIIIPSQDSTRRDFIMTRSNNNPNNNAFEPYSIIAESKDFSIQRVYPEEGSNNGIIVMGVYGFDFEDETGFKLISQDKSDTITPIQQAVMNSTEGRAHFDLRHHDSGQYDVYAVKKGGDRTRLDQGFEVSNKGYRRLNTSVSTPSIRLVGNKVYPKVFAGNSGKANAYDVSLNILFFGKDKKLDDLNVRFNGSDGIYDGSNPNPPGKKNIGDTLGIKYYSVYYPLVPSSSNTTFTFEMSTNSVADVRVMAFWSDHPKTEWGFTGDVDDLYTSRFIQNMDSLVAREIGMIDNTRGKLDDCSEDLKIENMEKEVMDELKNQVICIHPFTPSAWAKRNLAEQASKGALKNLGVKSQKADNYAEIGKKVYEKKQQASTWWNRIPGVGNDPHYSDQINFVFDCLQKNEEFQKKFAKNRCEEVVILDHPEYPDGLPVTRNRCTDGTVINNGGNGGGNGGSGDGGGYFTKFVASIDPNEIIGPSGYTALKLVEPGKKMNYDIFFENKAVATSPAQEVKITNPLPENANLKSFQLGKVAFGDTSFNLPKRQRATRRYKVGTGLDRIIVRVKAGVDPINREAFWTLSTIDPKTGLPPKDPSRGFLPPNDTTGSGEGFVSYQIDAKNNLNHGDSITNKATIVFDDNAPIQTNTWVNLVATDPLKSKILQDYQKVDSTSVALQWKQVTQEPFSTEVSGYNLYVSKDDNDYERWLSGIPDKKARFTGEPGETYYFISQAIGVNGTNEPFKNNYDVKVTFDSGSTVNVEEESPLEMLRDNKQVNVYPNPSANITNVRFKLEAPQNVSFELMNSQGQVITTLRRSEFMAGTHKFRFNPASHGLAGGLYFLIMRGESTKAITKWIYMK